MVWLEPADLSNQEKKSFQSDAGRKERADKRKADQKARKAKGKARARSWGIHFIRHDNSSDCWVLSSRIDDGFHWCQLLLADWALLIVNWVDYGFTIRLEHRLSDHSWLYFLLSVSCQSNSSIVVKIRACRFLTRQMNWLGFCCFCVVFWWTVPNCWCDVSFVSGEN